MDTHVQNSVEATKKDKSAALKDNMVAKMYDAYVSLRDYLSMVAADVPCCGKRAEKVGTQDAIVG